MKFSIIIPVYNCADNLHVSVKSIINQAFTDWELILINDGSKDNSLAICDKYAAKDNRIRVVNQSNAGAGPARNHGIQVSQGEYLIFCDADDYYEETALENFDKATVNKPDLIISSYQEFKYEDGVAKVCFKNLMKAQYISNLIEIRKSYIDFRKKSVITAPWGKVFRRDIVVSNHIQFVDLRRCQDVAFNLAFYEHVRSVMVIEAITYNYQTPDDGSYLKKFPINMFEIHKTIYQITTNKLCLWNVYSEKEKQYLNEHFMRDAIILLRLNYKNNWNLTREEQKKFGKKILHDSLLVNATKSQTQGIMNSIIRFVLQSKQLWLVDFFSWGTLVYQKMRRNKT